MIQLTLLATKEKVNKISDFEKTNPCFFCAVAIEHEGDLADKSSFNMVTLIAEDMIYQVLKKFGVVSEDRTTTLKMLYESMHKKDKENENIQTAKK